MNNQNDILVSVIIPVYNGQKYLEQAIKSVINQPCKNIEVLVINDGSKDRSAEISEKLVRENANVRYYEKENEGIGATRNFGIKHAIGKYVAFLDQDDVWIKNFYNNIITDLLDQSIDIIGFSMFLASDDLSRGIYIAVKNENYYDGGLKVVESSWMHHSSFLFRREFLQEFKLEYSLTRHEDEIFRHKCLYVSKHVRYVNLPIFVYRNNPSSETHRKHDAQKVYAPLLRSWGELIEWHEKNYSKDIQAINFCKKMRCIYSIEGIEALYKSGLREKQIQEFVDKVCPHLKEYKSLEFSKTNYDRLFEFEKKKSLFVIKNRAKGLILFVRGILSKSIVIRKLYEKKKYSQILGPGIV